MPKLLLFFLLFISSTVAAHSGAVGRISVNGKKQVLSCSIDNTLKLWDVTGGDLTLSFRLPPCDAGGLFACALSLQGSIAACAGWRVRSGSGLQYVLYAFKLDGSLYYEKLLEAPPLDLEFSHDGKRIAATFRGGGIGFFDAETGNLLSLAQKSSTSVYSCSFDPEGNLLSADSSGVISFFNREMVLLESQLISGSGIPVSLAVSPSGKLAAIGFEKPAALAVFSVPSLSLIRQLDFRDGRNSALTTVEWNGDETVVLGTRSGVDKPLFFQWEFGSGLLKEQYLAAEPVLDLKRVEDHLIFGGLAGVVGSLGENGRVRYFGNAERQDGFALKIVNSLTGEVTDSLISIVLEISGNEQLVDFQVFINGKRMAALFTQVLFDLQDARRRVIIPLEAGKNVVELWGRGSSGRTASVKAVFYRRKGVPNNSSLHMR